MFLKLARCILHVQVFGGLLVASCMHALCLNFSAGRKKLVCQQNQICNALRTQIQGPIELSRILERCKILCTSKWRKQQNIIKAYIKLTIIWWMLIEMSFRDTTSGRKLRFDFLIFAFASRGKMQARRRKCCESIGIESGISRGHS